MRTVTLVTLAWAGLIASPALPQPTTAPGAQPPSGSVGRTVTDGLPDRAASTTAVGRTKPAGAPLGDGLGTRSDLEEKSREIDRKIGTGICTGCK